jgi:hypothetical protein
MSALYVYGVMRAEQGPPPSRSGVWESPVDLVEDGPLAALVSEVPDASVPGRAKNLTAHTEVLRAAMDTGTVLPMRFGVVMPDTDAVKRDLLESRSPRLASMLDALDGRIEMTVSGLYREEVLLREIVMQNHAIAALRDRIHGKPDAATHFDRVRLGELVSHAVEAKRDEDSAAIVEALRPFAVAFSPGELLHERMVMNCAFLVDRATLSEFDAAVERESAQRAERMQFKLTGPLPPFSFVATEEPLWA